MNIDELPVEMLMKIFRYLDRYKEVSLVNKHFYNVWCSSKDWKISLDHLCRVSINFFLLLFDCCTDIGFQ